MRVSVIEIPLAALIIEDFPQVKSLSILNMSEDLFDKENCIVPMIATRFLYSRRCDGSRIS